MTITVDFRRLFFWRRISALEAERERIDLALKKALLTCEKLEKMLTALLIADSPKKPPVTRLRNQSEIHAFLGENYDAPS